MKLWVVFLFFFFLYASTNASTQIYTDDSDFPVPENLKENVAFWTMIYTDISLNEGVLHDITHPMLIYKRVPIGNRYGKNLDVFVKNQKDSIIQLIRIMQQTNPKIWNNQIRKLYKEIRSKVPDNLDSIEFRIRFQTGQKERFLDGLVRSGAYIDTIRSILLKHNVPARLAFLPHVESSFNHEAYSKVGASGLWQLMPETAQDFIRVDYAVDERKDPIRSTEAAAKYLAKCFKKLNSWPLTVTAYNYGLNGSLRALQATGSSDLGVILNTYESSIFRFASRNFYSCFIAASNIALDPKRYFGQIQYATRKHYSEIRIVYPVSLNKITSIFSIPKDVIEELNPALNSFFYKKDIPLPRGITMRFPGTFTSESLAEIIKRNPDLRHPSLWNRNYDFYIVSRGEWLEKVAVRFNTTKKALMKHNNLKSQRIREGQVLLIPVLNPIPDITLGDFLNIKLCKPTVLDLGV